MKSQVPGRLLYGIEGIFRYRSGAATTMDLASALEKDGVLSFQRHSYLSVKQVHGLVLGPPKDGAPVVTEAMQSLGSLPH